MKLRVAKKVLKDEFEFRCPCDGPWGFHKKSTIARAQRRRDRSSARAWRGLDLMVAPADDWLAGLKMPQTPNEYRDAILEGIQVMRLNAGLDEDRELDRLRETLAMVRMDRAETVAVPGLGIVVMLGGGPLTQDIRDYAAEKIKETANLPYATDPEKP